MADADESTKRSRKLERTISFFELVKYKSASANEQMQQVDWTRILTFLDGQTLGDRTREIGGRLYIGEVIFAEEHAHLKLLKVRDREAWMGIYDAKAKRLEDIVQGDTSQLYETSIVSFLDFGNIIGIIQGSTSAPTATAVCEWIEELGVLGKGNQLATQAVLSKQAREDLTRSSEATRIETTVSTTKAQALEARGSKLSGILRSVTEQFGPMKVTVILQTSTAKDNTEGRQLLRAEAEHLAEAAEGNDVMRAKAKLRYIDADEKSKSKAVDFVKQRITAKKSIGSVDADGNRIRNLSAVTAIMQAATEHEKELRDAVGVAAPGTTER